MNGFPRNPALSDLNKIGLPSSIKTKMLNIIKKGDKSIITNKDNKGVKVLEKNLSIILISLESIMIKHCGI